MGSVTAVIDTFEGTSPGASAIFHLLAIAGVDVVDRDRFGFSLPQPHASVAAVFREEPNVGNPPQNCPYFERKTSSDGGKKHFGLCRQIPSARTALVYQLKFCERLNCNVQLYLAPHI